jgi:hypothetical protein
VLKVIGPAMSGELWKELLWIYLRRSQSPHEGSHDGIELRGRMVRYLVVDLRKMCSLPTSSHVLSNMAPLRSRYICAFHSMFYLFVTKQALFTLTRLSLPKHRFKSKDVLSSKYPHRINSEFITSTFEGSTQI